MIAAMRGRAFGLTLVTLFAFAGNSILARMALRDGAIDPVAFTSIRLASGAFVLCLIVLARSGSPYLFWPALGPFKWQPAAALFAYAIAFSLAYVWLDAGAGALLLFSAVQATMIGASILRGDHPGRMQWLGIMAALAGLGWLLAPGSTAPPLAGALLMLVSGVFWGLYSLLGQGETDPVAATARNFILTVPLAALLVLVPSGFEMLTTRGVALAILSGTLTSGLGYVIWYAALRHLTTTIAAIVQLAVPVIAAIGGVALMGEVLTLRLALASALILGGIYLTIRGHKSSNS